MIKRILIISALATQCLISCNNVSNKQSQPLSTTSLQADTLVFGDSIIYQTENLIIRRISNHIYQHISFLNTDSFGRVACNGMLVVNGREAIVFDTPAGVESSQELIDHVTKQLNCKINAIVATHFHADCVAGLEKFHEDNIPSYAYSKTIELLKTTGSKSGIPKNSFEDKLTLNVGDKSVLSEYFGEGHTKDNVVGYFPDDEVIFGGCLIKEVGAGKGNLEDANVSVWAETVGKLKQKYPKIKIVIPGHGKPGGSELFDYTINLFK